MLPDLDGKLVNVLGLHEDGSHWLFTLCEDPSLQPEVYALLSAHFEQAGELRIDELLSLELTKKLQGSATRLMAKCLMQIFKGETGARLALWRRASQSYTLRRDIARVKVDLAQDLEAERVAIRARGAGAGKMLVPGARMRVTGVAHSSVSDQIVVILKLHPDMVHWIFTMEADARANPERYALPSENLVCLGAEQRQINEAAQGKLISSGGSVASVSLETSAVDPAVGAGGGNLGKVGDGPRAGCQMRLVGVAEANPSHENRLVTVRGLHADGEHWLVTMLDEEEEEEPELFAVSAENLLHIDDHLAQVMLVYQETLHRQGIRQLRLALLYVSKGILSRCVYKWRKATQRDGLRRELAGLMANSNGIKNLLEDFADRIERD